MKNSVCRVLSVALLSCGTAVVWAQTAGPTPLIRVIREELKQGKGAVHEKAETAFVRAFSKTSAYPSYLALETIAGPTEAWFIERYDSYAALEAAQQATRAEPLKSALEAADAQDGDLRTNSRMMLAVYEKDLSYEPVPPNLAKARYVQINTIRIRPGKFTEFADTRKLVNAAFAKSASKQRRVVYRVTSGAPTGTYFIISALETLKSLDPQPNAMTMPEAFGEANLAKYRTLYSDTVLNSEMLLFSINPRMSSPPKEFLTADPDFWAPKPKSTSKP